MLGPVLLNVGAPWEAERVDLQFEPLNLPHDGPAVVEFLSTNGWPFHSDPHLSSDTAAQVRVESDDLAALGIYEGAAIVGLLRLMDLADLEVGSPLFDLRIAEEHRGRRIGRRAVTWLTDYLFTTYPAPHRIEATTRDDNAAMQSVLERCGYRLEGRFVEAWTNADFTRSDALSYAILRREHHLLTNKSAS